MFLDDIYVMWIPIVVVALMAALGAWRGVYRELGVSAAIVLSALIVVQWATQDRWARDLSATITGLGAGEWQFFLTLVLMGLLVAVVGYGLGGLFTRRSASSTARTLGAILGLANGAALTGWVLRAAYEGLVNRSATSAVYQNPISHSFMVWAGWFPVALAVIGAIAALVYSLRGERVASEPAVAQTAAIPIQASMRPTYSQPVQPIYQPHAVPPAQARVDNYAPHYADPQSTMFMPAREQSALAPTMANPTVPSTSAPYATAPTQFSRPPETTNAPPASSTAPPPTPPFGYDLAALWGEVAKANQADQANAEIRCRNCGNRLLPGATFCTECGTRVEV